MRRKEKQITDQDIVLEILSDNVICRIAFSDNNCPYLVPMNYGYFNNALYLHSASEGQKIDIIHRNNKVCFEITDSIKIIESEKACGYGTAYRSVIGFGRIFKVLDREEKKDALNRIMKQHTNKGDWSFDDSAVDMVTMLKIQIESITGKESN